MVESAGAGASAHDASALASYEVGALEEALAAKRLADEEALPARRIAALEAHVARQEQHLALAQKRLADERAEQGHK